MEEDEAIRIATEAVRQARKEMPPREPEGPAPPPEEVRRILRREREREMGEQLGVMHYDQQVEDEKAEIIGLRTERNILRRLGGKEEADEANEKLQRAVAEFHTTLKARYDLQLEWAMNQLLNED